ncbi:MAG: hypothetical protein AAF721_25675 [Myxococcota bacterium]
MHLTTLVGILEREQPGVSDGASTRGNLARLYAEQGLHEDAVAQAERALLTEADPKRVRELRRIIRSSSRRVSQR